LLFQCARCSDIILFSSWDKLWIWTSTYSIRYTTHFKPSLKLQLEWH
jgi:hypothetical protein